MNKLIILCLIFLLSYGCASVPLKVNNIESDNRDYEILGEGVGTAVGVMLFNVIAIRQNNRFLVA